jgi:hypothetical protein
MLSLTGIRLGMALWHQILIHRGLKAVKIVPDYGRAAHTWALRNYDL